MQVIRDFITNSVRADSEYLANSLNKSLELAASATKQLATVNSAESTGVFGKMMFQMFDPSSEKFEPFSPLNFSIKEVAQEMTLMDSKLLKQIPLHEFNDQSWSKKNAHIKSPFLLRFIEQSNRTALWVSYLILSEADIQRRRKVLKNLIVLCEVSDYHSKNKKYNQYNEIFYIDPAKLPKLQRGDGCAFRDLFSVYHSPQAHHVRSAE